MTFHFYSKCSKIYTVILTFWMLFILSLSLQSQDKTPKAESEKRMVSGKNLQGYSLSLDVESKDVKKSWRRYLDRDFKLRESQEVVEISPKTAKNDALEKVTLYSQLKEKGKQSTLFFGLVIGSLPGEVEKQYLEQIPELLEDFALNFMVQNKQEGLKEAEKAGRFASKQFNKVNKRLGKEEKRITNNEQKIKKLKAKIQQLEKENEGLEKAIEKDQQLKEKHLADLEKIKIRIDYFKKEISELD